MLFVYVYILNRYTICVNSFKTFIHMEFCFFVCFEIGSHCVTLVWNSQCRPGWTLPPECWNSRLCLHTRPVQCVFSIFAPPFLLYPHCTASPLASFLNLTDSKDSLCSPCSNGCGASHLIGTALLGDTGLKKTASSSPSSHQLSVAPQLGVEAGECSVLHAGMLTGIILCWVH